MDDSFGNNPSPFTRTSSLRSSGRTSLVRRNKNMSAKQICFYRNGDRYFSGLKLAVSPDRYKEFDSLLAELSQKLNLPTGAVRFIFNSEDNSLVSDVTELRSNIPYVCSSTNTLRQMEGGYGKQMQTWSVISKSKEMSSKSNPSVPVVLGNVENIPSNSHRNESARDFIKPKLVTVIKNSKPPQRKVTLLLNSKTAVSLDQVFDQLSAKGALGKVEKLCCVDGRPIKTLRDLYSDDTVFIALTTNERFPEEGIQWDPNNYRINHCKDGKRSSCGEAGMRRTNSVRLRKGSNNENRPISASAPRRTSQTSGRRISSFRVNHNEKIARPRSASIRSRPDSDQPSSACHSDTESENECDRYSMFGIKKDKQRLHTNYRIGRIIGDGNFAIVRECIHRKSDKSYALKIINKSKVKGKEHMIENEIYILRKICHPNIVKLHEEFETTKEIYLVMELVAGGDLFDSIVANTRFSEPDSAYMIRDLTSAVKYLHDMNIVHRDIKPENLLVVNRKDGRKAIKLADFGLSIEVKSPMFLVCGTPTYVAPEILDESGYGLKVDIWAIGVICYILLCGFPPFRSSTQDQEELFDKILRGDYEYLSPFWDDIDDSPRELIDSLLVVDTSERFEADDILQHFWIKKWVEPAEKIQRELSEAEESNMKSRKRLRGIAAAIQQDMKKNQSYISSSLLNTPISESGENENTEKKEEVNPVETELTLSRDGSDVVSSDDEQKTLRVCQPNGRTRPVSLPYNFEYRPASDMK